MWVFNIYLDNRFKISRDNLVKFLSSNLIETRNGFVPINYQKCITEKYNVNESDCPNANYIMDNGFYLPSGNNISNEENVDKRNKSVKASICR